MEGESLFPSPPCSYLPRLPLSLRLWGKDPEEQREPILDLPPS